MPDASDRPDAAPERPAGLPFALALTALFAVAVGLGLARHEMWLDELQAWGIAFHAAGPREVLANLVVEGHPPLWHLILHAAGKLWARPEAMQVVSGLVATTTVFLVAWRSPFTPLQKALFAFGYFPFFEFGVIARSYGLGLMVIAAYCALWHAGARRLAALAVPLGLAALTSIFGVIVAWAMAVHAAVAAWDREASWSRREWIDAAAGALVLAGCTALALKVMVPPPEGTFAAGWTFGLDEGRLAVTVDGVVRAFLPIPRLEASQPWETNVFFQWNQPGLLAFLLSAAIVVIAGASLAGAPAAQAGWLAGTAVLFAFTYIKYGVALRHQAHHLVLWLACLWVAGPAGPRTAALLAAAKARLGAGPRPPGLHPAGPILLVGLGLLGLGLLQPSGALVVVLGMATLAVVATLAGWTPALERIWAVAAALRPGRAGLTAFLALHAAIGLWFWGLDLRREFSVGRSVAEAAREVLAGRPDMPVVVADTRFINYLAPVLAGYLGRQVVYATRQQTWEGSYIVWDRRRPGGMELHMATDEVARRIATALAPGAPLLFATETPLLVTPPGMGARLVTVRDGGILPDEGPAFALYEVWKEPGQGPACPL